MEPVAHSRVVLREAPVFYETAQARLWILAPDHIKRRDGFDQQARRLAIQLEWGRAALGPCLSFLEHDFALVVRRSCEGRTLLVCGHRNRRALYVSRRAELLLIQDHLPAPAADGASSRVDPARVLDFLASGWATGPFEYSDMTTSILDGWQRVPAGHFVTLERSGMRIGPFDNLYGELRDGGGRAALEDDLRHAVDGHLAEIAGLGSFTAEFSGGIDSGIVVARACKVASEPFLGGLYCRFPYVEFEREQVFREAIMAHTGLAARGLDPASFLPFSMLDAVPFHDEPTVASTSWGQFASSAYATSGQGGRFVLTGHGGDTLFRFDPARTLAVHIPADAASWFSRGHYSRIAERALQIAAHVNRCREQGFGGLWHPSMFESGLPARMLDRADASVEMMSGLMSRDILRAAACLWLSAPSLTSGVQKPFAYQVFGDDLPAAVWRRVGKVDHLGIVFRGAVKASESLMQVFASGRDILEIAGVDERKFKAFLIGATQGRQADNPIFSQLMALLVWQDRRRASAGCVDRYPEWNLN